MESIEESASEIWLAGYLLLIKRYAGSKSERFFPKLIPADGGSSIWLRHRDDDSFNHTPLRALHGRFVKVKGAMVGDDMLIVNEVAEVPDPIGNHE
jgi:hypothetical protein